MICMHTYVKTNKNSSTKFTHSECSALKIQTPKNREEKTTSFNPLPHIIPLPLFYQPELNGLLVQQGGICHSRKSQQHYIAII